MVLLLVIPRLGLPQLVERQRHQPEVLGAPLSEVPLMVTLPLAPPLVLSLEILRLGVLHSYHPLFRPLPTCQLAPKIHWFQVLPICQKRLPNLPLLVCPQPRVLFLVGQVPVVVSTPGHLLWPPLVPLQRLPWILRCLPVGRQRSGLLQFP